MHAGAYLVAVAGGSGSGKTSLVRAIRERCEPGSVCHVSQDDYYLPKEMQAVDPNGRVNFDLPTGLDLDGLASDLTDLVAGEPVRRKEYTFNQCDREPSWVHLEPAPLILVEGLFILHHPRLRELFDLRIYVEASEETQLERRLKRDASERCYGEADVRYQWEHHVMPAYRQYLEPYRDLCDLHVMNEHRFDNALQVLADHLSKVVEHVRPITLQLA
ncbi:MAG: hypothetical protein KDB88_05795 [Flavobacteriales bacterium]|nr:hypothetical protein [Flavobacteriales bacterium]